MNIQHSKTTFLCIETNPTTRQSIPRAAVSMSRVTMIRVGTGTTLTPGPCQKNPQPNRWINGLKFAGAQLYLIAASLRAKSCISWELFDQILGLEVTGHVLSKNILKRHTGALWENPKILKLYNKGLCLLPRRLSVCIMNNIREALLRSSERAASFWPRWYLTKRWRL